MKHGGLRRPLAPPQLSLVGIRRGSAETNASHPAGRDHLLCHQVQPLSRNSQRQSGAGKGLTSPSGTPHSSPDLTGFRGRGGYLSASRESLFLALSFALYKESQPGINARPAAASEVLYLERCIKCVFTHLLLQAGAKIISGPSTQPSCPSKPGCPHASLKVIGNCVLP